MGGSRGDSGAGEARAREEARQASIRAGMSRIDEAFNAFNDDFFEGRRKAYVDYALPQLDEQWADAQQELTYALQRGSLLNSSAGAEKLADARRDYDRQKQAIEATGMDYSNQARGDVERNRSDIIAQLNATADPSAAAQAAANRAAMLSASPAFQPLGQLFQNITANIGAQLEAKRAHDTVNRISLYGVPSGRGSGRVVA
jgi:hypothetical protein